MKIIARLILSLSGMLLLGCSQVYAVEANSKNLPTRVSNSDAIAVVKILSRHRYSENEDSEFFRVRASVQAILKGSLIIGDEIDIKVNNSIHEMSNDCCEDNRSYIVFLTREKSGLFALLRNSSASVKIEEKR